VNAFLNFTLLVMMAALLVSGIRNSHQISPLLGEHFGYAQVWKDIHDTSNVVVMLLVSLHLGMNWDWIVAIVRRTGSKRPVIADTSAPPTRRPAYSWNRLAGGLAIAGVAGLGVFATYLATASVMRPERVHMKVQVRTEEPVSREEARQAAQRRERRPNRGGIQKTFGVVFVSTLMMGVIARYVFRVHL
jgi:hypothetical protein